MNVSQQISQELNLKHWQVENTIRLLDDGNTIPFIARYRKEATGELNEEQIRNLAERLNYLRQLESRKREVLRLIAEQDKLAPELEEAIKTATTLQTVEDLYLPYRPKRRTRATIAREKGLEPLADIIWKQETHISAEVLAAEFVDEQKEVANIEQALDGACDILAERIAEDAKLRQIVRQLTLGRGVICSEVADQQKAQNYAMYHDFSEEISSIPPHRILALNRGEKEGALRVRIIAPEEPILKRLEQEIIVENSPFAQLLQETIVDAYKRLLAPSIEREVRNRLTDKAEEQAIRVFADNLRNLLMQPPIKGKVILGLDPAYRTGCKLAVVDATGKVMATETIYPHVPQKQWQQAKQVLLQMIESCRVDLIAIGNGTASRESEMLIAEVVQESAREVAYFIISEAGASVYSASKLAREELPDLDVSMRGAVSIARRALDPLAELVKIDPKSIGVGMYQHDVNQKRLGEALHAIVESCVNAVGVDLNTASPALLSYVAGISSSVAHNIVEYRNEIGPFRSRQELLKVKRLGLKTFEQCAGFLRIRDGSEPLDNTGVHPESYHLAEKILQMAGIDKQQFLTSREQLNQALSQLDPDAVAEKLGAGKPTVRDIIAELKKPGRDPRDEMPQPIFHKEVLSMEMLRPGMVLRGTVRNVVDFGAFVDIGVKQDGLVHISELSHEYVRDPREYVAVGDIVTVMVKDIDLKRGRIALTMKL